MTWDEWDEGGIGWLVLVWVVTISGCFACWLVFFLCVVLLERRKRLFCWLLDPPLISCQPLLNGSHRGGGVLFRMVFGAGWLGWEAEAINRRESGTWQEIGIVIPNNSNNRSSFFILFCFIRQAFHSHREIQVFSMFPSGDDSFYNAVTQVRRGVFLLACNALK